MVIGCYFFVASEITLKLVGKLSDADWKEIIPQVGLRAALRKEAAHLESVDDDSLDDVVSVRWGTRLNFDEQISALKNCDRFSTDTANAYPQLLCNSSYYCRRWGKRKTSSKKMKNMPDRCTSDTVNKFKPRNHNCQANSNKFLRPLVVLMKLLPIHTILRYSMGSYGI